MFPLVVGADRCDSGRFMNVVNLKKKILTQLPPFPTQGVRSSCKIIAMDFIGYYMIDLRSKMGNFIFVSFPHTLPQNSKRGRPTGVHMP